MSICLKRKSVRQFTDAPVEHALIETLLKSAMQAPSARNQQPWEFVVIKNRSLLDKLAETSGGAAPLKRANIAILTVMMDDVGAPMMAPQDMSAATQNILLEASNCGLGAVWIGVYPREERLEHVRSLVELKAHRVPFSLIAIGHPAEPAEATTPRYDQNRVTVLP